MKKVNMAKRGYRRKYSKTLMKRIALTFWRKEWREGKFGEFDLVVENNKVRKDNEK